MTPRAAAFVASFLAFQLELLSAKTLLPLFGGSAFVWTVSMMLFQALLLAGYLFARWAIARPGRREALVLFFLPILLFPFAKIPESPAAGPAGLALTLLRLAGLPFLALSTASLLIQDSLSGSEDPYFIYAASNAGALAGLLSYPFLIEPHFTLRAQTVAWRALYAVCAGLMALCLRKTQARREASEAPSSGEAAAWILYSAAASAGMLACSNSFAYNLAAAPLLWTIPLAIYLSTFILAFKRRPWLASGMGLGLAFLFLLMGGPSALVAVFGRRLSQRGLSFAREFIVLTRPGLDSAALFVLCMLCQKALALTRPKPARAPGFYVCLAFGGWLGSFLIAVLVPWSARSVGTLALDWGLAALLALAAWALGQGRRGVLALTGGAAALAALAAWKRPAYVLRNFYGVYEVADFAELRKFYHGNTVHGMQYLDCYLRPFPMGYYHPHSPYGELYEILGGSFNRVGAVGLGIGSIAAYGKAGQRIDFYELDGDVERIARDHFYFLKDSKSRVSVIVGDARLSLAKTAAVYDLIVLDAFASDAIPVHLLTREAFELYLKRLAPGGVIACHISNRLLDLKPVLAASAASLGLAAAYKETDRVGMRADEEILSHWAVLSADPAAVARLKAERGWKDLRALAGKRRAWTDQYASILDALPD